MVTIDKPTIAVKRAAIKPFEDFDLAIDCSNISEFALPGDMRHGDVQEITF